MEKRTRVKMRQNEEPYALFFKVLEYNGFLKNEDSKHKQYFPVFATVLLTSVFVNYLVVLLYLFEDHPFMDKAETLQCLMSMIHVSSKIIYYKFGGQRMMKRIMDDSVNIWKEMRDMKKYDDFLNDTRIAIHNRLLVIMGIFVLTTPAYGSIVFIRNLTLEPEERELIYKIWDPLKFFISGSSYYYSRLVYEVTLFTYALYTIGSLYVIYFVPCYTAAAQMRSLMKMLSSKDFDVAACVKFHQKVLKFVKDLNRLFSGQMFFEIILSALTITFRSYQLIQMLTNYDPRALGVFFFFILCFLAPFLVCISGQLITDASEDLFRGTYQNQWYTSNVKDRKSLCIMMTTASIPLNLCYRNTMTFNMDRYMTVIQATYSYITVLINDK